MNREIKFRAYNKTYKLMDYDIFIDAYGKIYQDAKRIWDMSDIAIEAAYDELVIMQYIGLKDKNGKDIYEGDIVKPYTDDNNLAQIIFIDGSFKIATKIKDKGYLIWNHMESEIKILGNIYENLELIINI
jgi:uncharacterized phage protein (TIGR01671 family)